MKKRIVLMMTLLLCSSVLLTGCIPGDGTYTTADPAGFFWGIWHGWVAPVSLLAHFIDKDIRIYEPINTGWPYDFGFYMAIISGFGGLSLFRHKRHKDD